jgi:hypothetical protein
VTIVGVLVAQPLAVPVLLTMAAVVVAVVVWRRR